MKKATKTLYIYKGWCMNKLFWHIHVLTHRFIDSWSIVCRAPAVFLNWPWFFLNRLVKQSTRLGVLKLRNGMKCLKAASRSF